MKSLSITLLALSLACPVGLLADTAPAPKLEFPAASPPGTVKQRVGITDVEINYSRPSAKDRKIFGGLVPYGEVWRTGANQATQISFSTPVKLNGKDVSAGTYEVFTIPGEDEWTVIFHKPMSQWGAYTYDEKNDIARVQAKPTKTAQSVETFTIAVSDLQSNAATLSFAWDQTRVPVKIEVDTAKILVPKIEELMSSNAEKKPYAQAAMFYAEQNIDLKKALTWMDAAITAQPEAFYLVYQKARILSKMGDKAGALAAAQQSLEGAKKAQGGIRDEYVRLNEALIASLK